MPDLFFILPFAVAILMTWTFACISYIVLNLLRSQHGRPPIHMGLHILFWGVICFGVMFYKVPFLRP